MNAGAFQAIVTVLRCLVLNGLCQAVSQVSVGGAGVWFDPKSMQLGGPMVDRVGVGNCGGTRGFDVVVCLTYGPEESQDVPAVWVFSGIDKGIISFIGTW